MQTLVLNAAFVPVSIISPKKAMKNLYKEKAELIETYADGKLDDWRSALEAPSVIRLMHFMFPPKKTRFERFTRKNIWLRDKGLCQYCGKFVPINKMHWDHVVPREKGGKTTFRNIVCSCLKCNQKKSNKTDMKPKVMPKPMLKKVSVEQEMMMKIKSLKNLPSEAWKQYIYFNVELGD